MNEKTKKILIIAGAFFAVLLVVLIIASLLEKPEEDRTKYLIPEEGRPQEAWPRKITVEEKNGEQRIVNNFDRYAITMPRDWIVNESDRLYPEEAGLRVSYGGEFSSEEYPWIQDGVMLMISTFDNPKNLGLVDWISRSEEAKVFFVVSLDPGFEKATVAEKTGYKASYQLTVIGEPDKPLENSLKVDYIFQNPETKNIYAVSCVSMGENFNGLVQLCEQQIPSFEILN